MHPHEETRESLWALFFGPAIWAIHFLLTYITAAIWCAKFAEEGTLGAARIVIGGYTLAALVLIGLVARRGWYRHGHGFATDPTHSHDTDEDRHRFLAFASWLLAGLAMVATLYVASAIVLMPECR